MLNDGGNSGYKDVSVYVLFAARKFENEKVREFAKKFRSVHINTSKSIGGEIIDLDSDRRLESSLSRTQEGKALYSKIAKRSPAICIGISYIGDVNHVRSVKIIPLEKYKYNYAVMFDVINKRMTKAKEKNGYLEFLELINKLILLQPNIAGVEISFNAALENYINKLKQKDKC